MPSTTDANDGKQKFVVRLQDHEVVFVPITEIPMARNFFLLDICEKFRFSETDNQFLSAETTGTLSKKHGENMQKLKGFKSHSVKSLLDKVKQYLIKYQLGNTAA